MIYDRTTIEAMIPGLSLLGGGGGGSVKDGLALLSELHASETRIEGMGSVDDGKLYVVSGGIGAPSALHGNVDRIIAAIGKSVTEMASLTGLPLGGILPTETGIANSLLGLITAERLRVPIIDADGAGRAVPSIDNVTYAHDDISLSPVIVTSPFDTDTTFVGRPPNPRDAEGMVRSLIATPEYGRMGGMALFPQTGAQLKRSRAARGSFARAIELGRLFGERDNRSASIINYLKSEGSFIEAYLGKLKSFALDDMGGFDKITTTIVTEHGDIIVKSINENLKMTRNGSEMHRAPDLISLLLDTADTGYYPYNNGDREVFETSIGRNIIVVVSRGHGPLYTFSHTFDRITSLLD